MLLEKWLAIDTKNKKEITAMMPKRVKRRKEIPSIKVSGDTEDKDE
jgi:hypothetical protein